MCITVTGEVFIVNTKFNNEETDKKEVALTFDDWANEVVVLKVLDILDEYDIKSTFYLKSAIINENPNLA